MVKIVADSSCDISDVGRLADDVKLSFVPLKILVEDKEFVDDEKLNIDDLLDSLKDDYKQLHLNRFNTKYDYRDAITKLDINDELSFTLKYPKTSTNDQISDIGVYIWQININ